MVMTTQLGESPYTLAAGRARRAPVRDGAH